MPTRTRRQGSCSANHQTDFGNQPDYSGPSLMLASSQIQSGLLDTTQLSNCDFFATCSSTAPLPSTPATPASVEEKGKTRSLGFSLGRTKSIKFSDANVNVEVGNGGNLPPMELSEPIRSKLEDKYSPIAEVTQQTVAVFEGEKDGGFAKKPKSKLDSLRDSVQLTDKSGDRTSNQKAVRKKFTSTLVHLRTFQSNHLPPSWTAVCSCGLFREKKRIIVLLLVLLLLIVVSSIVLGITMRSTEKETNSTVRAQGDTAYSPTMTSDLQDIPTSLTAGLVCANVSCLRLTSILTERLDSFKSLTDLNDIRGQCTAAELSTLTRSLAFGDKTGSYTFQNTILVLKQRLVHSAWASISEALLNASPYSQLPNWMKKLAFLFQQMISETAYETAQGFKINKTLESTSVQSGDDETVTQGNNLWASGHETLNTLLQKGNIAFHGLDNVLINVQLDLRVPLFFSAWITKSHSPGLMETKVPYLDALRQPELPDFEELSQHVDSNSASYGGKSARMADFEVYVREIEQLIQKISQTSDVNRELRSTQPSASSNPISVLQQLRSMSRMRQKAPGNAVRMTMRELMRRTQHSINFPRYLGAVMTKNRSIVIPRDLAVWVTDVEYFERLGTLLYETSYNDLQGYISFCILHKYAGFVLAPFARMKYKMLEPLAADLGMHNVDRWPQLLELASSGLRVFLFQRWLPHNLGKIITLIQKEIFEPVRTTFEKLLKEATLETKEKENLLRQIELLQFRAVDLSIEAQMEDYYAAWEPKPNLNLLNQIVGFSNFLSLKALQPSFEVLLDDSALSSGGQQIARYLPGKYAVELSILSMHWPYFSPDMNIPGYLNFGLLWYSVAKAMVAAVLENGVRIPNALKSLTNTVQTLSSKCTDQWIRNVLTQYVSEDGELSHALNNRLTRSFVTMEIVGRVYLQYTEQHISDKIPRLPEIRLPENVLFYLWILQNECDKAAENSARVDRNLDKNKIDDCLVVRIATHLSPSFRDLLKCPLDSDCNWSMDDDTSGDRNPRFSQRVFYPPKPNR